jgi:plastocyanin
MKIPQPLAAVLAILVATPALGGDIKGTIKYEGTPPKLAPLPTNRDQKVCGQAIPNETIEVSNGALKGVIVTVEGSGAPKSPPKMVTIDQHDCRYQPHVQAAPTGSTVQIVNSDPLLHNIHGYLGPQTLFNVAMPIKGQKIPKPLPRSGVVHVKCDIHAWMNGYLVVSDYPYAVDGDDGSYTIAGVPPGTYKVKAWHEKLGEQTAQVTVPASGDATADFTFSGTGAPGGARP